MKNLKQIRKFITVSVLLWGLFGGCQQDEFFYKTPLPEKDALLHWVGTHDSLWNVLLMEKIARYEHKDSLSIAYERDLKILIYAERYYRNHLVKQYGADSAVQDAFLYRKWQASYREVMADTNKLLDYDREWNLYRRLYYKVPPAERAIPSTRSDDYIVRACDFNRIVGLALDQLNLWNQNQIMRQIYDEIPLSSIFGPVHSAACSNIYNNVLTFIEYTRNISGPYFEQYSCEMNLRILNQEMQRFVECIQKVETALKDHPLPPDIYFPPYPGDGGGSGGGGGTVPPDNKNDTTNYDRLFNDCSDATMQNGQMASGMYVALGMTGIESQLYTPWLATDRSIEWGCTFYIENGKLKLTEPTIGTENSCPLRGIEGARADIHTHPKGNGPSLQDVFHLVDLYRTSDGIFKDSYVYTSSGKIYNLHVADSAQIAMFNTRFEAPLVREELNDILVEYTTILEEQRREVSGDFEEGQHLLFAIAALLKKAETGIVLTEKQNDIYFYQIDAEVIETQKANTQVTRIIKKQCKY